LGHGRCDAGKFGDPPKHVINEIAAPGLAKDEQVELRLAGK
jgi:hypothetical protein